MRRGLVAAALGAAGAGAAVGRPTVVLLAAVPLTVLVAGFLTAPAAPRVAVDRELSNAAPTLGERVTVSVTVENEGGTVADCHVADELPEAVDAVAAPRTSVRLPAGATTTFEYDVVARRGRHEFGAVAVTARGLLEDATVEHDVESSFRCSADARPLALRASVGRRVGGQSADTGGSGVEFHSVREYRPSDPQRRIDWRRYARTRELTTVEFREERAATVHLLVDARPVCDVRGRAVDPSALAYCADATERLARALLQRGVDVGVGLYPGALDALPPAGGRPQRNRVERLLEGHAMLPWGDGVAVPGVGRSRVADGGAGTDSRADADGGVDGADRTGAGDGTGAGGADAARGTDPWADGVPEGGLPEPLRRDARVLLVSPCLDDAPVEFATTTRAVGGDVGVLAPDVGGETPGAVVERVLRAERLGRLDAAGVPAADWRVETPLSAAVEEVFATWT